MSNFNFLLSVDSAGISSEIAEDLRGEKVLTHEMYFNASLGGIMLGFSGLPYSLELIDALSRVVKSGDAIKINIEFPEQ